ncbi:MAG: leucyl aminopeptidase [Candidatus Marinimicrobia bacterium]|nr:leucyl aminopeptidase [Candidatus Neomarinimicrobiota bacterium]
MAHLQSINATKSSWKSINEKIIAVGIYKDGSLTPLAKKIDDEFNGSLRKMLDISKSEKKVGRVNFFYFENKIILMLGLGKKDRLGSKNVRLIAAAASRSVSLKKIDSFAIECFCNENDFNALAEGIILGSYKYLDYKTNKRKFTIVKSVTMIGCSKTQIRDGVSLANAVCFSRDIANSPANVATPSFLEQAAIDISKAKNMYVKVFDREEFTNMGMGALAGVAQGSDEPPKFIILEYKNGGNKKPKIIVGKGLTFDSGGISIKPASKMDEMKYDMCGAAVVLGVFKAISVLQPNINLVGIVPSTENLSGSKAYKPGDILTAYNGKTIEVLNTDAEGRLILADALSYASKHYDPEFVLDFATLTGAVVVALGSVATGILGNDKSLIKKIKKSSKITSEKVWQLPLWSEYCEQVKSNIADVKNTGAPGQAGTIAGAAFLKSFVGNDIPWVHFDIAGTAWGVKPSSINPRGSATGWGIRLVLDLIKK